MTFPALRNRTPSEPVVQADLSAAHGTIGVLPAPPIPTRNTKSGALSRIMMGVFGTPNPESYSASAQVVTPKREAFYHFHEGDLFTPGTGNFVFEPTLENPLQTIWGRAFLRRPNTFDRVDHRGQHGDPRHQAHCCRDQCDGDTGGDPHSGRQARCRPVRGEVRRARARLGVHHRRVRPVVLQRLEPLLDVGRRAVLGVGHARAVQLRELSQRRDERGE